MQITSHTDPKHVEPVLLQMILHTGDMRWQPRLAEHPALKACKVDLLYMDTTYCSPKHVFPSQVAQLLLSACVLSK